MSEGRLIKNGDMLYRVLDEHDSESLIINCTKKSMPQWVSNKIISEYVTCPDEMCDHTLAELSPNAKKTAYSRFSTIANIVPYAGDKEKRSRHILMAMESSGFSRQTITTYLWKYLSTQTLASLAAKDRINFSVLTEDQKNIRWALNKYYYTAQKHTLKTAYTMMLKAKYCDNSGVLLEKYPSYYQFRYFYRTHMSRQTYYISRNGIKSYQRSNRPLLGDSVQDYAGTIGMGMLDSTVCDVYLVNEAGGIVGRPILTACIDAYSGMCCGYYLSWEGGVYSLRGLMLNIIADKQSLCRQHGIDIDKDSWNCSKLPATIITDMGREYVSDTFEQLSDLGVTIVNLPPYRPELKGPVEKFFDVIQSLYRPYLIGKGFVEPDFRERGKHDYRKDACLDIKHFEKIVLYCIIHYNSMRMLKEFPYSEKMIADGVRPFANCIWNYELRKPSANLISVERDMLIMTLLPRVKGKFSRYGFSVNGLRYKNSDYTEQYLKGGEATAAYNPDDISCVWLLEKGRYIKFTLIEKRFNGKNVSEVQTIKRQQKIIEEAENSLILQGNIDLAEHIQNIVGMANSDGKKSTKGIRKSRKREQSKTHVDFAGDEDNGKK